MRKEDGNSRSIAIQTDVSEFELQPTGDTLYRGIMSEVFEYSSPLSGKKYCLKIPKLGANNIAVQYRQLMILRDAGLNVPEEIYEIKSDEGPVALVTSKHATSVGELLKDPTRFIGTEQDEQELYFQMGQTLKMVHTNLSTEHLDPKDYYITYRFMTNHPLDHFFYRYILDDKDFLSLEDQYQQERQVELSGRRDIYNQNSFSAQSAVELLQSRKGKFISSETIKLLQSDTSTPKELTQLALFINSIADVMIEKYAPSVYFLADGEGPFLGIPNTEVSLGDFKADNILAEKENGHWSTWLIDPDITLGEKAFDLVNFTARHIVNTVGVNTNNYVAFLAGYGEIPQTNYTNFSFSEMVLIGVLNTVRRYMIAYTQGQRGYDLLNTFIDPEKLALLGGKMQVLFDNKEKPIQEIMQEISDVV